MNITERQREKLRARIQRALKELKLDSFKVWVGRSDQCSLVVTIAPKGRDRFLPGLCQSLTAKGRQCKIEPVPGEQLCPTHLTMSKERK